jgi:hypothetical protein
VRDEKEEEKKSNSFLKLKDGHEINLFITLGRGRKQRDFLSGGVVLPPKA